MFSEDHSQTSLNLETNKNNNNNHEALLEQEFHSG